MMAGIIICIFWVLNLKSYRSLNTAKYKVIHRIEEKLPIKLFDDEWELLDRGQNKKSYLKLSVVEQGVPITFIILYSILLIIKVIGVVLH